MDLRSIILLFCFGAVIPFCYTQDLNEIIGERLEYIAESNEIENIDLVQIEEQLLNYLNEPLAINKATAEELKSLTLLNDFQVQDVLLHIKMFGKFISKYELQTLPTWNMETIQLVLPFIRINDRLNQVQLSFHEVIHFGKFEFLERYQRVLENKAGYTKIDANGDPIYLGSPDRLYSKFRFKYRSNISVCILGEKDAGEQFFKGKQQNGFDYYAGHLYYHGGKYLKTAIVGDFQVQLGQGLNLWSGYGVGKSSETMLIKKTGRGIRPYQSLDENRFMRGAAAELSFKHWNLISFSSSKSIDVNGFDEETASFTAVKWDGFHRSKNETKFQDRVKENISGGALHYSQPRFSVGINAIHQAYSHRFDKPIIPYNKFDFRGKSFLTTSVDCSFTLKNMLFFSEVSHLSTSNGTAQIYGALFSFSKEMALSVLYRDYDKDYFSIYNNGFSEGSAVKNEKGIYVGLKMQMNQKLSIQTYVDLFKFPWLKYMVNAPSNGYEYLFQPKMKFSKSLVIYGRYRLQLRQKNSRDVQEGIIEIEDVAQENFRVNVRYQLNKTIRIQNRIEHVKINRKSNAPEKGVVIIQDFIYKPMGKPLAITFRYALFETDSYDSRIYSYEANVLGVYSVPAYYYAGNRCYLLFRYSPIPALDIWLKYGRSVYFDRDSIGSGYEEIKGPIKTEVSVQVRWTL